MEKRRLSYLTVIVAAITLSLIVGLTIKGMAQETNKTHHQQLEEYKKQQDEARRQLEKAKEQQEEYDKILATWEAQQNQFQKYLDKLEKRQSQTEYLRLTSPAPK